VEEQASVEARLKSATNNIPVGDALQTPISNLQHHVGKSFDNRALPRWCGTSFSSISGLLDELEAKKYDASVLELDCYSLASILKSGQLDSPENLITELKNLQNLGMGAAKEDIKWSGPPTAFFQGFVLKERLSDKLAQHNVALDFNIAQDGVAARQMPIGFYVIFQVVLYQLINNAIDELAKCQRVNKKITLSTKVENKRWFFRVSDNAGGISPELRDKVFDKGVSSKGPGRGLALSICQAACSSAQNYLVKPELRIESTSNKGTTFVVAADDSSVTS
jgi:signal transduction histidine kinase